MRVTRRERHTAGVLQRRGRALAAATLAGLLAGCATGGGDGEPRGQEPSRRSPEPSASATESAAAPVPRLPPPLSRQDVEGETIRARPFADFAVASGDGVWVTGVDPGAVRYDARSGRVTASAPVAGAVEQAVEQSAGSVWVPTNAPQLLRIDAETGRELARTRLPGTPLAEAGVGAVHETAYVLVGMPDPVIVVVERGRVTDRIEAPVDAVAVRAGYGALWVPTGSDTVERYDLRTGEWASIPSGSSPRFLDVGYGAVWVMNQGDGTVTWIDGRSGDSEVLAANDGYILGGDLTCGAGAVWLRTDDSVLRIDPRTREVTHRVRVPAGSGSAAATREALVITNHDHLAVHRVPLPLPG